ncbi:unnamed protein product [Zymoseptoria tritici ST99CH_3D7]|uniref:Uncharacterized protein n=1 Tax=Zymoseptoria tritici (strain ST99CH_3D7) TaxID=1276538 RepID=A0A1X7RZK2_ZYMT9|nr:unnamed protein product [Zymoseptoria tritici ST99CH_3D7]
MSQSTEVSLERHDPQIAIDRLHDLLRVHNRRSEYPWYQVKEQDVELLRDIILRVFDFESSKYETFIRQANARGIRVETPVQNPMWVVQQTRLAGQLEIWAAICGLVDLMHHFRRAMKRAEPDHETRLRKLARTR